MVGSPERTPMEHVRTLIAGAGVSGLATAAFLADDDFLVLERDAEIGGYCKTVKRDGFVWDYSGHFFHFKRPEIEAWLRQRMPGQRVLTVEKRAFIDYRGSLIDFPFQKNIHQLEKDELVECLHDAWFAEEERAKRGDGPFASFKDMLYARLGRAISEKFLIPYNEKLYATDLATLDPDAMGRFFPHTTFSEIVKNMRTADNASYNSTFSYPEGGAAEYVKALAREVPSERIALGEPVIGIDLDVKVARTARREIRFERLVSSLPFPALLAACARTVDASTWSWNKVLVFNLGFDKKGPKAAHWIYYPSPELCFYRVGFYDNIFESDRMSLYVEIGLENDASVDVEAMRARVLADLKKAGVLSDHELVAWHSVVMDPAYVHITKSSIAAQRSLSEVFAHHGVHSIGRYGRWTYCSIEDNIVEAKELVARLDSEGT
jgi:protoporphyrinogen oxidase